MLNLFYTALMFYTRIPVPKNIDHSEDMLNRATVFFPLIGWIVGAVALGTYWVGSILFPPELAILLSMVATIWTTGAFHEDGFADVCDGFGGGWTQTQILTIMKDSRLGTYGMVGLGLLLAVKFFALKAIFTTEPFDWPVVLKVLAAHSLSRLWAVTVIAGLPYAREDATSKVKPVAKGITGGQLLLTALFGLLPLLALASYTGIWLYLLFLLPLGLVRWWLIRFFRRWIGGYTGDCLGATQQLSEVVLYLSFVSFVWISI
ncbi:adenosylcobinamide-GDP ribazoletransferase [Nibrella saemangeumensis]|uniref:Adenosylcobinamide-GDP ribazoletransferase n=1 Tax=Nibrella saemangeumensis TaxID=1084526 RepID=A0ABP8NL14_9BACT